MYMIWRWNTKIAKVNINVIFISFITEYFKIVINVLQKTKKIKNIKTGSGICRKTPKISKNSTNKLLKFMTNAQKNIIIYNKYQIYLLKMITRLQIILLYSMLYRNDFVKIYNKHQKNMIDMIELTKYNKNHKSSRAILQESRAS